ncbi:MAG: 50S ribosomal protein L15 [Gemmataceae bacterium]|nr:50S ribosomal protein L15 [Gemmataceae bacterium]
MDLTQVHQGITKRKLKKRVGRGIGSGHGKTASRGHKGQYASAGARLFRWTFEGGQMPLFRRIPKRGFSHGTWDEISHEINVGDLDTAFEDGAEINLLTLRDAGIIKSQGKLLRILGEGEVTKRFIIVADHVTKSATEKIKAKGGTVTLIPKPKKPVRNKMGSKKAARDKALGEKKA